MRIIIAGKGINIYFLAKRFISKGYFVSVISNSDNDCDYYARNLRATVIRGEFTDAGVLEQAEGNHADIFIGMTARDQDNLVLCLVAKDHYHIPHILAVVNDPDNENVFRRMGLRAISPSRFLLESIESMSALEEVRQQFSAIEGRILLTELEIGQAAKVAGKKLREITLPGGVLVGAILRGEETLIPQGDTLVMAGDRLLILSQADNQAVALTLFN